MPVDLKKLLTTALAEIEREEEHDRLEARFKALEEKKPEMRLGDIVTALENASDDELTALEGTVLSGLVKEARENENENGDEPPEPPKEPKSPKATKLKRPGRKSGMAYDWWVDDDGNVVKLDMARVYSGEDEEDEVEYEVREAEKEDEE